MSIYYILYTLRVDIHHTTTIHMFSNINRCRLGLETSQPRVAGGRAVSGDGWWLSRVDSGRWGVRWNRNGPEFDQDEVIVMRICQERTSEFILNSLFSGDRSASELDHDNRSDGLAEEKRTRSWPDNFWRFANTIQECPRHAQHC